MAVLRSTVQSIKAVLYFTGFGLDLLWNRPKTRPARAAWLNRSSRALLRAFDIRCTIEGSFPERGVLVTNHTGYLDIIALAAIRPAVFCAKAEMEHWPVLGWMATMAGTVYVARGAGGQAAKANDGMRAAEAEGVPVIFFPEGTTSNGEQVLPFRSGLIGVSLEAGQPITAGYLHYALEGENPPDVRVQDDVAYWGDEVTLLPHIWKLVGLRGVHIHVRFADGPIQWSHPDLDRKQAATEARAAVLAMAPADVQERSEEIPEPETVGAAAGASAGLSSGTLHQK